MYLNNPQTNRKLLFLFAINPVSGGHDKSGMENAIRNFFTNSPHEVRLFHLNGKTDEETLTQQINQHQPDRVVAVGGDGTLKLVATHLLNTPVALGIVPAGSANGMARELNIPTDLTACLQLLVDGTPSPIDVITVNETDICLHLSDIGLNAHVVKYYQQNNWRGMFGYLRAVLRAMRKRRLLRIDVTLDDTCVQRTALMVVLANARMYGTGAVINPDGNPADGQFEVVIFRRLTGLEILKLFWHYKPFNPKNIEIHSATSVSIESRQAAYFQVDGEYRGRVNKITARIRPGALQVIR